MLGRDDIGHLAPGMAADFVAFTVDGLRHAGARHDPVAALVFCGAGDVAASVIDGRVVVREGQLSTLDLGPHVERHSSAGSEPRVPPSISHAGIGAAPAILRHLSAARALHVADGAQRVAHGDPSEPVAAGDQRGIEAAARRIPRPAAGPGEGRNGPDRTGAGDLAARASRSKRSTSCSSRATSSRRRPRNRRSRSVAPTTSSYRFCRAWSRRLRKSAPQARLTLHALGPDYDYERALADGGLDIVIGNWPEPPGQLHLSPLLDDELGMRHGRQRIRSRASP